MTTSVSKDDDEPLNNNGNHNHNNDDLMSLDGRYVSYSSRSFGDDGSSIGIAHDDQTDNDDHGTDNDDQTDNDDHGTDNDHGTDKGIHPTNNIKLELSLEELELLTQGTDSNSNNNDDDDNDNDDINKHGMDENGDQSQNDDVDDDLSYNSNSSKSEQQQQQQLLPKNTNNSATITEQKSPIHHRTTSNKSNQRRISSSSNQTKEQQIPVVVPRRHASTLASMFDNPNTTTTTNELKPPPLPQKQLSQRQQQKVSPQKQIQKQHKSNDSFDYNNLSLLLQRQPTERMDNKLQHKHKQQQQQRSNDNDLNNHNETDHLFEKQVTERMTNKLQHKHDHNETDHLLLNHNHNENKVYTTDSYNYQQQSQSQSKNQSILNTMFQPPVKNLKLRRDTSNTSYNSHRSKHNNSDNNNNNNNNIKKDGIIRKIIKSITGTTTKTTASASPPLTTESIMNGIIGSLLFGLFHIVFCLAQASAITRPYSNRNCLASMVRVACMGNFITTPFYIFSMVKSFPDLYPSVDPFLAPFYVKQALIIDEVLVQDKLLGDNGNDDVFLTTFCVVAGIGLLLAGLLLMIATKYKLANIPVFLPYPCLAGFFSTVGLLLWTLAFSVDTGKHMGEVFIENIGNWDELKTSVIHHVGSIAVAILMQSVHSSLVPLISMMTIPGAYALLFFTGTSLENAREMGWFWYNHDFKASGTRFKQWAPPLPFGVIAGIFEGNVHWGAVWKALPVTIAMAFIYFVRCSLHTSALKKNAANIEKWREDQDKKALSELNNSSQDIDYNDNNSEESSMDESESVRPTEKSSMSMAEVYTGYGKMLILSGIAGGSACLPALGPSAAIAKLGIRGTLPQYGSAVILLAFYLTDFGLLGYIPKITFSSLLVLTAFTMVQDWFLKSYSKIKQKGEWAVVPLIVILSFTVGVLPSVFIGVAISTFIFVDAFYKSGTVKYISNGLIVHSTTERSPDDTKWLDLHGDLIQLVVLQNYLFFGNAYSCFNYIQSMFEEPSSADLEQINFPLPPIPKYLIIDATLVTGIDASAVDVFADIISLCHSNGCKVLLSGLRPEYKEIFRCGGVKPSPRDRKSVYFILSIPSDMDTALRRAEDGLIMNVLKDEEKEMRRRARNSRINTEDGFMNALQQIDSQHHMSFASKLKGLASYTEIVTLFKGEPLSNQESGLFFIEHGILKVERNAGDTTRKWKKNAGLLYTTPRITDSNSSIGHLRVRTPTIGRQAAILKEARRTSEHLHTVRLARIGPGFVVGSLEACAKSFNYSQGIHTAVTPCRLHMLSNESISIIEQDNPNLALELYKMMIQLSVERQASTIDQLATLQSIMVSLGPTKPTRITMGAIQEAMKRM